MKQNKIFSLLGIAMRGRNLVSGEYQSLEAVRTGAAALMIVAQDASDNTKKLFSDKCSFYGVPIFRYGTKESLGRAIGKDMRSSVCVCDRGLAEAVISQLREESGAIEAETGMEEKEWRK